MHEESQMMDEMHRDLHILRLGYQDRANFLPLLYPVKAGWVAAPSPWNVEVRNDSAQGLIDGMLAGELDAAFLPPGVMTRNSARFSALGGWGLAGEGKTETALLLAPQRIDLIDGGTVSITPSALGSTAEHMLRTLVTPYYGIEMKFKTPEEEGYDANGARLMFGDEAARERSKMAGEWVAEDMGVAWFVLSGLPAVWEMLVVQRDLEALKPGAGEQLQGLLKQSLRSAQEQRASVLDEAVSRLGLKEDELKELFARQRYSLGEVEQKGLARFLDQASRARVIAR